MIQGISPINSQTPKTPGKSWISYIGDLERAGSDPLIFLPCDLYQTCTNWIIRFNLHMFGTYRSHEHMLWFDFLVFIPSQWLLSACFLAFSLLGLHDITVNHPHFGPLAAATLIGITTFWFFPHLSPSFLVSPGLSYGLNSLWIAITAYIWAWSRGEHWTQLRFPLTKICWKCEI